MLLTKTTKTMIIIGAVGIVAIIGTNLLSDIESNFVEAIDKKIKDERDPDILKFEERVDNLRKQVSDITSNEMKSLQTKISEFKKSINYNESINAYKLYVKEGVDDFRKYIDADNKIKEIKVKCELAISNYKAEHSYDAKLKMLNKKISDAEDEYSSKKAIFNTMSDDFKEESKALKKVAKKTKNNIVDSAKKEIKELEDDFNTFKTTQESIRDSEISKINEDIRDVKESLEHDANKAINELKTQVREYTDDMSSKIFSNRTENEQLIIDEYDSCKKELDDIHQKELDRKRTLLRNAKFDEKFALYLTNKGFKKWHVLTIGFVPVIIVEFFVIRYIYALKDFSKHFSS